MAAEGIGRERGITLVELLVVMTILAFVAALVALNAPPARSFAKEEAEKFAARTRAAFEDAVIRGRTTSVVLSQTGYKVERLVGDEWKPIVNERYFSERSMPKGVSILATLADPAAANKAAKDKPEEKSPTRIILDPIGLTTPFRVEFSDEKGRFIVSNAADETITIKALRE